jgi:DNA-binding response OmpR family regulator
MDGFALCREIKWDRRTSDIPIILLSGAHTEEEAQVKGLEYGADDYLVKPISPKFLISKIRTVLRRYAAPEELQDLLTVEDLTLDVQAWTVTVKGKVVLLTRKEFDLLLMFLRKRGRVLRPAFLLENVWGLDPSEHTDFRTIKVHISSLRKKLGRRLGEKIVSVSGVGYRFDA